jgi:exopolysaccharide biosynthesis WecB/TagA/CpsF family protein
VGEESRGAVPPGRVGLLGLEFDALDLAGAARAIAQRPAGAPFAYVVTPNADHLVRLAREPERLGPLYQGAWLRLLDSRVVARLARLLGLPVPPVVPGSDLTAALLAPSHGQPAVAPDERVAILGMAPERVAALAARTGLSAIAHHDPPMGFEGDPAALEAALRFVERAQARLTFLAVGSPRQEIVARRLAERGQARGTALCIGASLLFLCGAERRAPVAVQRAGLEWAWRLAQDPRRLARRYLRDDPAILALLWREARARRQG